jgi:hypothetical protein
MTLEVVYTAEAADDIDAAINWLLPRMPSAVVDLLQTIRRTEVHLQILPSTALFVRRDWVTYAE